MKVVEIERPRERTAVVIAVPQLAVLSTAPRVDLPRAAQRDGVEPAARHLPQRVLEELDALRAVAGLRVAVAQLPVLAPPPREQVALGRDGRRVVVPAGRRADPEARDVEPGGPVAVCGVAQPQQPVLALAPDVQPPLGGDGHGVAPPARDALDALQPRHPVSYTHLTLPTICSV